ncbi:hypothetical protein [Paenibacillus thiaminolyticus]|nr:hypothetical protein [Paenibacillus thiaminolyticus]
MKKYSPPVITAIYRNDGPATKKGMSLQEDNTRISGWYRQAHA